MKIFGFSIQPGWRLWAGGGLVVALVLVSLLWLSGALGLSERSSSGRGRAGFAVEATPVERATVTDLRRFTGNLTPSAAFVVAPKVAGRLERLTVNIGDLVENGQVVARLDDDEQVQLVRQARAEMGVASAALQEARTVLEVMQRRLERSKGLFEKGIGSQADLETAQIEATSQEARLHVAEAQLVQRRAALRAAEVKLSQTVIQAQWSGGEPTRVVGERYASEGEMLSANKPILSVLDIDALTAVVFATEADYPFLQPGRPVTVLADAFPDRTFPATIARIAPQFQETSRQARMEVSVPNPGRVLKPGMFVRVEVPVSQSEQARVVPAESVVTRGGRKGVFMVEDDGRSVRFVPVRTGLAHGDRIQVLEPSLEGRVVSLGQHLLADGAPIRLVNHTNGNAANEGNPPRKKSP